MPDAPVLLAGRYRLGESLGRGGMGQVLLARDETLERDVAIKELDRPFGSDDAASARRTLREARAAARINHPNVVQVYDVLQLADRTWIVMEYVPCRSLREEITEQGRLDPYRVVRIGLDLLGALRAAHRFGVEHRDVKPANVLLADDGRVLLTDFGIAAVDDDGVISRSDILVGSPQFMAPERAQHGVSGPAADLWSLGATLYSAVEGRSPYERNSTMATLAALATEEPDPPTHAGALRPLLDGLLRKDPTARMNLEDAEALARTIITGLSTPEAPPTGLAGLAAALRIPRPRTPKESPARPPRTDSHPGTGTPAPGGSTPPAKGVASGSAPAAKGVASGSAPAAKGVAGGPAASAKGAASVSAAAAKGGAVADPAASERDAAEGSAASVKGAAEHSAAPAKRAAGSSVTAGDNVAGSAKSSTGAGRDGADPLTPADAGSPGSADGLERDGAAKPGRASDRAAEAAGETDGEPDGFPGAAGSPDTAAGGPEQAGTAGSGRASGGAAGAAGAAVRQSDGVRGVAGSPSGPDGDEDARDGGPAVPDGAEGARDGGPSGGPSAGAGENGDRVDTDSARATESDAVATGGPAAEVGAGIEQQPSAGDPKPQPTVDGAPAVGLEPASGASGVGRDSASGTAAGVGRDSAAGDAAGAGLESAAGDAAGVRRDSTASGAAGTAAVGLEPAAGGAAAVGREPAGNGEAGNGSGPDVTRVDDPVTEPMAGAFAVGRGAVPRQRRSGVPERDPQSTVTASDRKRRLPLVGAASLAVVVAAGAVWALSRPDGETPVARPTAVATTATAAPSPVFPGGADAVAPPPASPSSSSPSATPSASPSTSPATGGRPALRPGWVDYRDASGFSVYVPEGWTRSKEGTIVYFRRAGKILGIDQTDDPKPDPVADWREQSRSRQASGDFPGYDEVKIARVDYFRTAADWEFLRNRNGVRKHVNNRGVVVSDNKAYGFYWETPDAEWGEYRDDLQYIFDSFQPAK